MVPGEHRDHIAGPLQTPVASEESGNSGRAGRVPGRARIRPADIRLVHVRCGSRGRTTPFIEPGDELPARPVADAGAVLRDMVPGPILLSEDQRIMRRTSGGITLPAGSPAAGACAPEGENPCGRRVIVLGDDVRGFRFFPRPRFPALLVSDESDGKVSRSHGGASPPARIRH
jgi:hypothetical protein